MTLKRKTPLKKVRAKPRRVLESCAMRGCRKPPRYAGYCASHATERADAAFATVIKERDGRCVPREMFPSIACNGNLQTMHLISRRYKAVRWDLDNAVAGCQAHHLYLTIHPLEHDDWCERRLGATAWYKLKQRALRGPVPDIGMVIERLRQGAA